MENMESIKSSEIAESLMDNTMTDDQVAEVCSHTKERLSEILKYFDDNFFKLAEIIGISYQSLSKKLNNHVDFKRSEILRIKQYYKLDAEQIEYIFFD